MYRHAPIVDALGRSLVASIVTLVALGTVLAGCGATASSSVATREEAGLSAPATDDVDAPPISEVTEDDAASVHDDVADAVAEAAFESAEAELAAFESFTIDAGHPATLEDYLRTLLQQIRLGSATAARIGVAYEAVIARRRPHWTVAALVRQGRAYELLARAIRNAPLFAPGGFPPGTRALPPGLMELIRGALEPETGVVECLGVYRYLLALRAARRVPLADMYTREASDRLGGYCEQRIAECVSLMRGGDRARGIAPDPTIVPYRPGELDAAEPEAAPPAR